MTSDVNTVFYMVRFRVNLNLKTRCALDIDFPVSKSGRGSSSLLVWCGKCRTSAKPRPNISRDLMRLLRNRLKGVLERRLMQI